MMNSRCRKSKQGELFPPEKPPHLITDERREALIPLLSMIIAGGHGSYGSGARGPNEVGRPAMRGEQTKKAKKLPKL